MNEHHMREQQTCDFQEGALRAQGLTTKKAPGANRRLSDIGYGTDGLRELFVTVAEAQTSVADL
jgi:hypothetical protein